MAGRTRTFSTEWQSIFVASRWALWSHRRGKPLGFLELNTDVTERKRAEEGLRSLSARLLTLQDDERRRIARESHDSVCQMLVALALNVAALEPQAKGQGERAERIAAESRELIQRITQELRTISYLLHPPLLDEAGLPAAIRDLTHWPRFAQRKRELSRAKLGLVLSAKGDSPLGDRPDL